MNKIKLSLLFCLTFSFLFTSCFQDRRKEFEGEIGPNKWIYETMNDKYLWYEDMPAESSLNLFSDEEDFFAKLLSKNDGKSGYAYSTIESTAASPRAAAATHGYHYLAFYSDEEKILVDIRILYVLPGSPAQRGGLKRGDFISAINGTRLNTSNFYTLATSTGAAVYTVFSLNENAEIINERTVDLGAAISMEENPFFLDTVYQYKDKKVGYVIYNSFEMGVDDDNNDQTYMREMETVFSRIKAQQPDEVILDLRYNPGGYLSCAQLLASILAPPGITDQRFVYLTFNDKNPDITIYNFLPTTAKLDLDKLYVIVTGSSASASEAVIHGLIPYMGEDNITLVGQRTEGKNVGSISYPSKDYPWILHPIVCYVHNLSGSSDYAEGYRPKDGNLIPEANYPIWYELGDTREVLLNHTLNLIAPDEEPEEPSSAAYRNRAATKQLIPMGKGSIGYKKTKGNIIGTEREY